MLRTDIRHAGKTVSGLLLEVLWTLLRAWSLPLLLALLGLQWVILPTLGGCVIVSGGMYLLWCRAQRSQLIRLGDDENASLPSSNIIFARCWALAGILLVLLGCVPCSPLLVTVLGTVTTLAIHFLATWGGQAMIHRRERLIDRPPARPKGLPRLRRGTLLLNVALLFVTYVCIAYTGLVGANVLDELTPRPEKEDPPPKGRVHPKHDPSLPSPSPSPLVPERPQEEDPTYDDLCSRPRSPQTIGYGLGALFEEAGAVFAGCVRKAIKVDSRTWVAPGYCGPELRSLAVVGESHEPVLLYGEAAEIAWRRAQDRELSFAEVAEPEGGEVVLLGIEDGTSALVRNSPALRTESEHPLRCGEVEAVSGVFVELLPPLAALWAEHMQLWQTWSWPERDPHSDDVVFSSPGLEPAYGSCEEGGSVCRLDGPGEHFSRDAPAAVTVAELETWIPGTSAETGGVPL